MTMNNTAPARRPSAIANPAQRKAMAFTNQHVLDHWVDGLAALRPASSASGATIDMFDVIGADPWTGGGITAKSVSEKLTAAGNAPVTVRINSGGGDMFEGIAIYNVLREHPGALTVQVMGMAGSAASIIAMAGDSIEIGASSFIMIHNCWVFSMGNRHDMAAIAEWLAPFDAAMANVYAARTGESVATIAGWMDAETYMDGKIAIERGFADALLPSDQIRTDAKALAAQQDGNAVRAAERALVNAGRSRGEARALINKIKGRQDAADNDWLASAGQLLKTMKS